MTDYKSNTTAKCDSCGQPTYNRCSSSGMIICDDCRSGKKEVVQKPREVTNAIRELDPND